MSNIRQVVANVSVADVSTAIPFYQAISGVETAHQFEYEGLRLAFVGSFLLIQGDLSSRPPQLATILVNSMDPVLNAITDAGGEILEGPANVPNGLRVLARHPDGSIFEYLRSN